MERIYEKGSDTHIGSFRVYAHSDNKIYEEAEHTNQVKAADALKAFEEGRLQIVVSTDLLIASKIALTGATVYAGGASYATKTEA